ncbi:efflux RND transporter periplasmic adaptor subunit, partial [Escherichia coli]
AEAAAAAPLPQVTAARVIEQPISDWSEFTGRLQAPHSIELRPRVSGYIDRVAFQEGARVEKGDLLFQIDPRPFEAEIKRLQAQLQQARAVQTRARSEAERGARLRAGNAMSAEVADARTTAAQEAGAQVAALQAQLETARLNLEFTRITAPIAGRIGRAEAQAGNLVNEGATLLTTLVGTEQIHAYFDIDEGAFLALLQQGFGVASRQAVAVPVQLGLSNEAGTPHLGQLDFIDNQVNPRTGTMRARAVFDNADGQFTPGLYARLRLSSASAVATMLVRDEAIGTDLGHRYVLVLDEHGQVSYRSVGLGRSVAGLRIVREGLVAGERIVVNGLQRVRPGMQVAAEEVDMADAAATLRLSELQRTETGSPPLTITAKADPPPASPRS